MESPSLNAFFGTNNLYTIRRGWVFRNFKRMNLLTSPLEVLIRVQHFSNLFHFYFTLPYTRPGINFNRSM